ncbi:putative RNA-binding protein YlmH isoform X2 [Manihot esculenta]|uniref:putative RNA-binding protein YlmH isoform X2 n=1 Tax=Manihot esculenta TaxID=3983 RepID=UPI000B5D19B8|nr:putative RNA-binding protein YlmH isoform X2 [Manihot esculenta]
MCATGRVLAMAATGSATTTWLLRGAFQALALSHPLCKITNFSFYGTPRSLPLITPMRNSVLRICHLAQATKSEVNDLLKCGDRSVNEEVKFIVDMARRASLRRDVLHTDFLTPPTLKDSMLVLEKLADIKAVAQGGYPQAERCRLSVGHPEALTNDPDIVAALSITGNFSFQSCSHGDFLGAILSTGISREKVGDIILQVGNVSVSCARIPLLALEYEPPRTKTFKTVESSLRVDALASAGFKISRSKLVDLISNRDVRVNWVTITKNNTALKTGDIVSVSGKGRLQIGEINSTKKGKFAVELIRYL